MKTYEFAEIAYEAYRKKAGGKSLAMGVPIPEWSGLSQAIKDAWWEAAEAVMWAQAAAQRYREVRS